MKEVGTDTAALLLDAITGGAVTPHTIAFVERPDVLVLTKPFGVQDLSAAIDRVAGSR